MKPNDTPRARAMNVAQAMLEKGRYLPGNNRSRFCYGPLVDHTICAGHWDDMPDTKCFCCCHHTDGDHCRFCGP